jgi:polar amino acid transport system substrate-binding protein
VKTNYLKKTISWFAAINLLLLFFTPLAVSADPIKIVHSGEWPPYSDRKLPGQGLGVQLVGEIFKRAGYQTEVSTDSLIRLLEGTKIGIYDVFATAWYSDKRNEYLAFSKPYLETSVRFIKKKGSSFQFNGLEELQGSLIGIIAGYAYDPTFDQSRKVLKITERNLIQNLMKLKQGRIDATLGDVRVLKHQINQYMPSYMSSYEILERPLTVSGIHIAVSRANPKYKTIVANFNKALEAMIKDGSYSKIVNKYNNFIDKPAF